MGARHGQEEYWFYKEGCSVTLLDLDGDSPSVEPFLKTLPTPVPGDDVLIYHVGDLAELLASHPEQSYDMCYFSSFTPDELRRESTQETFKKCRNEEERQNYVTWPREEEPFMDLVMRGAHLLSPGGLFIYQSYKGGVDVAWNRHFISLIRNQWNRSGLELLELYYFKKSPAVILSVGFKGPEVDAADYLERMKSNPPMTTFHGRYPLQDYKTDIGEAFAAGLIARSSSLMKPPSSAVIAQS